MFEGEGPEMLSAEDVGIGGRKIVGANRRALPFTQPYKALKSKREKSNSKECQKSEIVQSQKS
mgnify:CR=1 FL=1